MWDECGFELYEEITSEINFISALSLRLGLLTNIVD